MISSEGVVATDITQKFLSAAASEFCSCALADEIDEERG
jgi:hypothetical protein